MGKSAKNELAKTRKNIKFMLVVFIAMLALIISYLIYSVTTYGGRWFVNPYNPRIVSERKTTDAGDIMDRNGTVLASTNDSRHRVYHAEKNTRIAMSHVVGDVYGLVPTGAESFYAPYLLGFKTSLFATVAEAFAGGEKAGSSIKLTVDAVLQDYAYSLMKKKTGSVVVMNYKTGEILLELSTPAFDPNSIDDYRPASDAEKAKGKADGETEALINRATTGLYTPGSVMKMVTAAAALQYMPDADSRSFECSGEFNAGGSIVTDSGGNIHGALNLKQAFAVSCNVTFASVASELGAGALTQTALNFDFNTDFLFSDLILYASRFPELENKSQLAWSGVGQHTLLVTPMHMAMITSAIANGGMMMEPKLLKSVVGDGSETNMLEPKAYKRVLQPAQADILQDYMLSCVEDGTGKKAAVEGYDVCGKTGTAEVSESGGKSPHAWFCGFVKDDDHPIAIVVLIENGGSGGSVAAPIAAKVLSKALELGY
ncbi:MAG: peptidoglycan D,D-transpeptidase FtsI family protein [Christensenellales bacterium]